MEAYTDGSNLGLVLWVLLTFGFAVLPFMYILQFRFNTPATGFVVLIILAIISGVYPYHTGRNLKCVNMVFKLDSEAILLLNN